MYSSIIDVDIHICGHCTIVCIAMHGNAMPLALPGLIDSVPSPAFHSIITIVGLLHIFK